MIIIKRLFSIFGLCLILVSVILSLCSFVNSDQYPVYDVVISWDYDTDYNYNNLSGDAEVFFDSYSAVYESDQMFNYGGSSYSSYSSLESITGLIRKNGTTYDCRFNSGVFSVYQPYTYNNITRYSWVTYDIHFNEVPVQGHYIEYAPILMVSFLVIGVSMLVIGRFVI